MWGKELAFVSTFGSESEKSNEGKKLYSNIVFERSESGYTWRLMQSEGNNLYLTERVCDEITSSCLIMGLYL